MKTFSRALLGLSLLAAASATLAADGMPQFTVAYFNGSCPEGWTSAELGAASGRSLVPTMPGGGAGGTAGEALTNGLAPTHEHHTASATVATGSTRYVLVGGGGNGSLGNADTYPMTGSAPKLADNLPYVQYNVCMKLVAPAPANPVPEGVATFHTLPFCPAGWNNYTAAAGRYLVGLPAGGTAGATFGGKPLTPGELRTHGHDVSGQIDFPRHNIAGAAGCCAGGYAASGLTAFTGKTGVDTKAAANDSAVQAPYFTATFCTKR